MRQAPRPDLTNLRAEASLRQLAASVRRGELTATASDLLATGGVLDCLVIGAGPAGLSAGVYLARYYRTALVVDGGNQRAALIPTSHNYPGYLDGIHGADLLERMRGQAREYGALIENGRVTSLSQLADATFVAILNGRPVLARNVLLATGVVNRDPVALTPEVKADGIAQTAIRYCPICDGYEARGRRVVVVGSSDHGVSEALFIKTYTSDLTIMPDQSPALSAAARAVLAREGIKVIDEPITRISLGGSGLLCYTAAAGGAPYGYDIMYPALGSHCATELAVQVGCQLVATDGEIAVDPHQATNIPGVYAAGDVVEGLDQIVVAQAQAAIACTAIHNSLRPTELQLETPLPVKDGANHGW